MLTQHGDEPRHAYGFGGTPHHRGEGRLTQWAETTLPQRVQAGHPSEGTLDSWRDTVDKHIIPHLDDIKITELSTHHIRVWLMELAKKPSGHQHRTPRPGEPGPPPCPPVPRRTRTPSCGRPSLTR